MKTSLQEALLNKIGVNNNIELNLCSPESKRDDIYRLHLLNVLLLATDATKIKSNDDSESNHIFSSIHGIISLHSFGGDNVTE